MAWYNRQDAKAKRARDELREQYAHAQHRLATLKNHNAPPVILEDEAQKVHELKLRLWGWTAGVPFPRLTPEAKAVN